MIFIKSKSKIAGIFTTLLIALVILSVSVLKSTTPQSYAYTPMVLSEKTETAKQMTVEYVLPYSGKIHPDSILWYPKVARDKIWYLFTFNSQNKTELNLLFADKRLSSALSLFQNNKPDLGVTTLIKAEKYLEKAVPKNADNPEYLKKLALATLKHREVIVNEILPLSPEDIRPKAIKIEDYSKETYKKARDLMYSIGLIPPDNIFELK